MKIMIMQQIKASLFHSNIVSNKLFFNLNVFYPNIIYARIFLQI